MNFTIDEYESVGERGAYRNAILVLRSHPTCHGIQRTVIDTARESFIFRFFHIILRLDPCQTGLLQLH